ncbi:MAG: coenzyme F420-0:L-glutamate ligase [Chloroflexi bacterium RBG_16_48_8]|nr:MAG: coenzyme F420-0:L-glutamate ligase [Chloroflexi bacterium RBG_16_48_8]
MTSSPQLILTALPGLPLVSQGDDLVKLALDGLARAGIVLQSGDILAIAQKIVSKVEGQIIHLKEVVPSQEAIALAQKTDKDPRLVQLILQESNRVLRSRPGLIIVEHRLGFVCANAGIDSSNVGPQTNAVEGSVLLLPKNPDASANEMASQLMQETGSKVGVLIIDSHGRAWREGAVGVTIGAAGLTTLLDLRGTPDLFGRQLQTTQVGISDELASAASILMGQAAECRPIVHIRGFPYPLGEGSLKDLLRPKEQDLFQ